MITFTTFFYPLLPRLTCYCHETSLISVFFQLHITLTVQKHTQNRPRTIRGRDKQLFSFSKISVTFDHFFGARFDHPVYIDVTYIFATQKLKMHLSVTLG